MFYQTVQFVLGACASAGVAMAASGDYQLAGPPNVLVIVLDDVGTDQLSFYGDVPTSCDPCPGAPCAQGPVWARTPTLKSLRENGILFRNAYANPLCSPTRACILTGRYAFRTGIGLANDTAQLDGSEVLIPELLKNGIPNPWPFNIDLPYACGAFGKWHVALDDVSQYSHAVDNGFDRFYGSMGNVSNPNGADHFAWTKVRHNVGTAPTWALSRTWDGTVTSADARNWINAQTKAFFAYVAFLAPHAPFQVPPFNLLSPETQAELQAWNPPLVTPGQRPPTGDAAAKRLIYRAMLEAVDSEIWNLLSGIDAEKLENTTIFVISDNGTPGTPPQGQPVGIIDVPHDTSHGKGTVYELGIRVPLIVSGAHVPTPVPVGGYDCSALVSAVDLWRTIAALTGASESMADPAPNTHFRDSINFRPLILNPNAQGARSFAHSQWFSPNGLPIPQAPQCFVSHDRAVRDARFKLLRKQTGCTPFTDEFYDLATDPGEVCDLLAPGAPPWPPGATTALSVLQAEILQLDGP